MDQEHHSASRAAALGGILAIISIGVTLMAPAPQSFIIGALLCWGSALSIAYYHPEFRLVVRPAFHREWSKYRSI
jgi:drug/metabolite transporter (DMT)-like permease